MSAQEQFSPRSTVSRRAPYLLALILVLYLVLGTLFAAFTPAWQAPDEPAHYNYVRYLAEHGSFPVLHPGDYPHAYLEEIKGAGFPSEMSIEPIRYEFHQPPLYYSLAAPVYTIGHGSLWLLRMFSVVLGAGIVVVAYLVARRVSPNQPAALGAAAFVAFLPQHLATVSQAGNDVLAELLFGVVLLLLVSDVCADAGDQGRRAGIVEPRGRLWLGALLGLVLITKTTAYIALPLAAGVLVWRWRRDRVGIGRALRDLGLIAFPACLLALPWFARNVEIYGWPDLFGLIQHEAIVVGQQRTSQFLAQVGLAGYLERLVNFTFKSFWGVFGWMGVFMDARVYTALAIASLAAAMGLAVSVRRPAKAMPEMTLASQRTGPATKPRIAGVILASAVAGAAPEGTTTMSLRGVSSQEWAARRTPASWLLAGSTVLTLAAYAWYNMQFVQHQGRYLFTALIPIALAFALGWWEALRPANSGTVGAGLLLVAVVLAGWSSLAAGGLPKWPLALLVVTGIALVLRARAPRSLDSLLFSLPYACLALLALYALFGAILPQLT